MGFSKPKFERGPKLGGLVFRRPSQPRQAVAILRMFRLYKPRKGHFSAYTLTNFIVFPTYLISIIEIIRALGNYGSDDYF
jgi:hypothetical protein